MSGIPPPPFFSGISVMTASVVRTIAAIEAAFWSAERVTLAGVDDAGLEHVGVLVVQGVVAVPCLALAHLLDD